MQLNGSYKDILKIGVPIMVGNMAHALTQAIDYAFMGRYGMNDLNGTLMAGMGFFFLVIIALGFTRGAQIIIARRTGEDKYDEVGKTFDQLLLKGIGLSIFIFFATLFFKNFGLQQMLQSEDIAKKASIYLDIRQWSVPLVVLNISIIAFYTGIGKTVVVTICTVVMSATNVLFDYVLIFGHWGFPEMGIGGAALATVIAEMMGTFTLFIALFVNKDISTFSLFKFPAIDWPLYGRMFNLSLPIVVQHIIGLGTWWLFFIMIEKISEEALAISGIIKSLYMLIAIPIWGFAAAINTIISNLLGQKKVEDVIPAVKKSIHISFLICLFLSAIVYLMPEFFLSMYTNDAFIISKSIPTLKVILLVMLFFSVGAMTMHAIMGIGDTITMLIIELVCIISYIAYAYFSIFVWELSLAKVWCSELVYWIILPVTTTAYLLLGKWKNRTFNI